MAEITLKPSRTAMITSLMRAYHTRYDCPALIDDSWGDRLVLPDERLEMARAIAARFPQPSTAIENAGAADHFLHRLWQPMPVYGGVIIRSRYTEDLLAAAASRGIGQYILLGAGFDTFAVRSPLATQIQVFEMDHPASQELKCQRLAAAGATLPAMLHFVPVDFSQHDLLAQLAACGFRADQPAFISWLGVTVYLTREANWQTLRTVGQLAPGSQIAFTYIERAALESDSPQMIRARETAAGFGEPWLTGFDSWTLPRELAEVNLQLVEDLGGREMFHRYCANRTDGFTPGRAGRIALAQVI